MNITDYIKTNKDFYSLAHAMNVGASRAIIEATTVKRDKVRQELEDDPRHDTKLKNDIVYKLGVIEGLNWILDLPGKTNEYLKNLEGDEA